MGVQMGRVFFKSALCVAAAFLYSASASALDVASDDMLCPLESISESEMEAWSPTLSANKGQLNDAQLDRLVSVVLECGQKLGWSEDDGASALELHMAILGGTALSENLLANGVNAEYYETVLQDRSAQELEQILTDPDNSPALVQLAELMIENLGSDLNDQIAGDLGTYIAFTAQSRYSTMKMMGLAN